MVDKRKKNITMQCPYCLSHYDSDVGCKCKCPHYKGGSETVDMICEICIREQIDLLREKPSPFASGATKPLSVKMTPLMKRSIKHVIRDSK